MLPNAVSLFLLLDEGIRVLYISVMVQSECYLEVVCLVEKWIGDAREIFIVLYDIIYVVEAGFGLIHCKKCRDVGNNRF